MSVVPLFNESHATPEAYPVASETLGAGGLRQAMRQLASGVSVITTGKGESRTGFTATSVSSLSVDPPRIIVSVNKASSSYFAIRDSGIFAVNFLASHHAAIADRFAGKGGIKGERRFDIGHWTTLETGAGILFDALASVDAEVEELVERHSHAIVIGRVVAVRSAQEGAALLYWRGRYDAFDAADFSAIA